MCSLFGVALEFKPQDMWVGMYWDVKRDGTHAWVCLVPMFPLHFHVNIGFAK
jgi:hypothetical protein